MAVSNSDSFRFTPTASAESLPFTVDHHVKIKEKVADTVRVEESMNEAERNCEMSCTYIQYTPGKQGKAGLAYVTDSPVDLTGAKRVHFFLMGDKGGETVKVKIAGKNPTGVLKADSPFKEKFAISSNAIKLTNDWQRYEIPLNGVDLKGITAPFAIEILKGKGSATQAIYFKFIVYENQAVDQRFVLATNTTDNSTALTADNSTALTADNSTALTADNSTAPNTNEAAIDNNPPIASNVSATTDQDKPVSITLQGTDSDDGDTVTFSVSEAANDGKISGFDSQEGTLTYTPPAGFAGQDAFNFKAIDNHGAESNIATVTVTINKVNSGLTACDDTATTNADDPVVISVLDNDSDTTDNDSLTIDSITRQPSSGTATINKNNGTITYTPNSAFTGTDTFDYSISDGSGGTDTAKVTVRSMQ